MNIVKKTTALAMAALMAGSLAACNMGENTKWVAKYGDVTIPAGVYIDQLVNQYSVVTSGLSADGKEIKDPMKEQVDGVAVPEKIAADAKKALAEYIAVEKKYDEQGLAMGDVDKATVDQMVESYWTYIGEVYQANGISKDSYRAVVMNQSKKSQLFNSIYGEGGSEAVPDSELKAKFTKDYAKIIVIPLVFSTDEDAAKKEDADKKTRELISKYEKLAKSGSSMEDLVYEAQKEATGNTELEKPAAGASYTFVNRESSAYDQKMTDAVFAAKLGEPTVVETDTSIYLFSRFDISENESDFTSRKMSLLTALKGDAFEEMVSGWADSLTDVTYNEEAFKRYTAQKLKLN